MAKGLNVTRNFWVVLVTLIVIGLMFTYYLMVYVKERERLIYDKKFRELERIADNIKVLKEELIKRAEGRVTLATIEYDGLTTKKLKKEDTLLQSYSNAEQKLEVIDRLENEINAIDDSISKIDFGYLWETIDRFEAFEKGSVNINLVDSLRYRYIKYIAVNLLIIRVLNTAEEDVIENEEQNEIGKENIDGDSKTTNKIISKTTKRASKKAKVIFQNFKNEIRLENIDSLIVQKNGLKGSGVTDIVLGNKQYKLFTHWLSLAQDDDLLLCGLEDVETIKSESTNVEPWIIINTVSILLFFLLGMPLLKLLIMNEVERLQIVNVLFTGVAIILGTTLVIFFVNFTNHFFGYHFEKMDKDLSMLSDSVKHKFFNETRAVYKQIKSLHGEAKWLNGPVNNHSLENKYIDRLFVTDYKLYNQIFWIDSTGIMPLVIASNSIKKQKLPVVKERKYFQAVLTNNLWDVNGEEINIDQEFLYVEFIRSMLDGQYQGVISTKLKEKEKGAVALALSTKMFSLQYSSLPPGYHACIIDEKGEVKFHSTISRSLQENFLDETDDEPELLAAVNGRIAQHASVTYDKKRYRAYIQPIDNMPLYLVVFYSLDYYKTPVVLTVWFTIWLIMALFLIMGVQLLLLFGITYRPSKLKIRRFFLTWLRPRKPLQFRDKYIQSIVGSSLLLFFFLILLIYFPVNKQTVAGLLLTPLFLLVFHYRLYADSEITHHQNERSKNIKAFSRWSMALVLLIDIIALYLFQEVNLNMLWFLLFQLIVALLLYVPFSKGYAFIQPYLFPNTGYKKLYLYSMLLWLALVSVLPVFYFYKFSYEEESKIWLRHLQLETAKSYLHRQKEIEKLTLFSRFKEDISAWGDYQGSTGTFKISQEKTELKDNVATDRYDNFLFELIPGLDSLTNYSSVQAFNKTEDRKWYWNQTCDSLSLNFTTGNEKIKDFSVSSLLPHYQFIKGEQALFFWIVIIGVLVLTHRTLRFALRNIYGFDILKPLHEVVLNADFLALHENKNKNFYMIGLPYSGKGKILKKFEDNSRRRISRINLQTQLERLPSFEDAEIVIIEHFEFGLNNHESNKLRLKLLQDLQAKPHVQVILCSAVQPYVILDYYDRMESLTQHLKERDEFKKEYTEYKHAKRYWRSVLSGFVVIYLPLNLESENNIDESNLISVELGHGTFLRKLESHVANQPMETFAEREDFVLKVEDLASPYYQSLWNSFSHAEKRLLYDLSIDRFLNVKNIKIIRTLLQKGVLVIGDSVQIFNKSFNNFILTVVKEDEEMLMQQEMRSKGSWNSVQLVLILTFLAMAVFVAFAQRDIMQNFNALMTALGGVTALLLRFGGLFTIGNKTKE